MSELFGEATYREMLRDMDCTIARCRALLHDSMPGDKTLIAKLAHAMALRDQIIATQAKIRQQYDAKERDGNKLTQT